MKSIHVKLQLLLVLVFTSGISIAQTTSANNENKEVKMSAIQRNKEVIRKLYDQSINKRNFKLLPEIISEDYVGIRGVKGAAGFQEAIAPVVKSFPDVQWNIQEMIGEGDKIIVRWKLEGTHTAQFQSYAATGKTISNDGIGIFELADGKIIKGQAYTDRLGFLQQIEVLPPDINTLAAKKPTKDQVMFIDKFRVPAKAKQEFMERVAISRSVIKKQPGFMEDRVYESMDENGNLLLISIAVWENDEAVKKAKEAVQAEYKKEGFDPAAMFARLNIVLERDLYKEVLKP